MSRSEFPLHASDISAFARSLNHQIAGSDHVPSHVELLNMLARSAGFKNYQHFRSQAETRERVESSGQLQPAVDYVEVQRLSRFFDAKGSLAQWPGKQSQRIPCLWVLWSRIPARKVFSEHQLNQLLKTNHQFGDPALLRRELYDNRMVSRTADCREYRRIERRPPPEAVALIHLLEPRRSA
jgi:hypothetical protein